MKKAQSVPDKENAMQGLPHDYNATATATTKSLVTASIEGQPDLTLAPPSGFGGPGDIHSPEDLQVAAVASCFILSFKAIAAASKLDWESLEVKVAGTLAQVDRAIQFTGFTTHARLELPAGSSHNKAERLLERAEQSCFITSSLKGESTLKTELIGGE
ncbi:MAG: OsmC family protein [Halieaceae bacterium]|nr:OsmC family protein [Halieaceae bacterium]